MRRSDSAARSAEHASLLAHADHDGDDDDLAVFVSPRRGRPAGSAPPVPRPAAHKVKADADAHFSLGHPPPPPESYVETDIHHPEDTLQSLSLKYNVPVAELKRLNQIIREQEFYALKRVKIPLLRPQSVLTELIPTSSAAQIHGIPGRTTTGGDQATNGWLVEHFTSPPQSHAGGATSSAADLSSPLLSEESDATTAAAPPLVNLASDSANQRERRSLTPQSRQAKRAKRFLRAMDKDLAKIRQKNESLLVGKKTTTRNGADEDLNLSGIASSSPTSSSSTTSSSRVLCWLCLSLVVIAILAILVFAKYEFKIIQFEHPPNITQSSSSSSSKH